MDLERVQRAGVSLFATKGFAATGIRELGSAAGINSATLYHYVGSKEDLLVSIMRACLEELIDAGAAAVRASSEPALQLAGLVSSHVGLSAVNQLTARVAEYEMRALSESNRPTLQEMRDEYEGLFAQILERGQRVGAFKTQDLTMARLAIMEMAPASPTGIDPKGALSSPLSSGSSWTWPARSSRSTLPPWTESTMCGPPNDYPASPTPPPLSKAARGSPPR